MEMASKTLQSPKVAVLRKVVLPQSAEPNQTVQKGSNQARDEWRHYRGVRPRKPGKFGAKIQVNGKHVWLRTYKTKIDAARAYDQKALELRGSKAILNFPPDDKKEEGSNQARNEQRHYRGVQERPGRKFRARIRVPSQNGKQVCLGTYKTKIDAARAYDQKALELRGSKAILNFPPDGKKRHQETTAARADGKKRCQETTPRGGGGGDNKVIVKKEEVEGYNKVIVKKVVIVKKEEVEGYNKVIVKKEEVEEDWHEE